MKYNIDKKENSTAVVTIEVDSDSFKKGLEFAYKKIKNRINVPGFRKGKASMAMVEKLYGVEIFFEDAVNYCIPTAYDTFVDENKELDIVSRPEIELDDVSKGGFSFKATVATKPPVTLGEYKNVTVAVKRPEVKEEELEARIKTELDKSARIIPLEDKEEAKLGDICVIDYEGFVDDIAFEGGKGEAHPLELGSNSFIPGFEDQLIGVKTGEHKDINVTFPEQYHSQELAGKAAVFKCYVQEIKRKEVPELDDELVQDISEFETVEEYKTDLRKKLEEQKETEFKKEKENLVMEQVSENATVELPDLMVSTQTDNMLDEHFRNISRYGLDPQKYMELTGMTMDKMRETMKEEAIKRSKLRLVLEEICKVENIQAGDDEVEEHLKTMAESYKMELDKLKEMMKEDNFDSIREEIKIEKTVDMLSDSATVVEPKEETEE